MPVAFTDPKGTIDPAVEQRVEIRADNATLLGFGSALCKTDEVFYTPCHDAYRGRALAVFRAGQEGAITVRASSAGYREATAKVEVRS